MSTKTACKEAEREDAKTRLLAMLKPDGAPAPHGTRNGEPDTAGGYALKHEWL